MLTLCVFISKEVIAVEIKMCYDEKRDFYRGFMLKRRIFISGFKKRIQVSGLLGQFIYHLFPSVCLYTPVSKETKEHKEITNISRPIGPYEAGDGKLYCLI